MIAHRIDTCCTTACAPDGQGHGKSIHQVGVEADEESTSEHKDDMEYHELELDVTVKEESRTSPSNSEPLLGDFNATTSSFTNQIQPQKINRKCKAPHCLTKDGTYDSDGIWLALDPSIRSECTEPSSASSEPGTEALRASRRTETPTTHTLDGKNTETVDFHPRSAIRIEIEEPHTRPMTPIRSSSPRDYSSPGNYHHSYLHASPGKDSGYGSPTPSLSNSSSSPKPNSVQAAILANAMRPDQELLQIKAQKHILKTLLRHHPFWRIGGVSLDCFNFDTRPRRFTNIHIFVLDRQEGENISFTKALSSRALRARTGLCLTLYDTRRQKFVTELQKAHNVNTPLNEIEAIIYIWNRETNTFHNLMDMLGSREARVSASLLIQHGERRPYVGACEERLAMWSSFVNTTDIEEFYLSELHRKGVEIEHHMDCILHTDSE
jgi:hypothetical protein